jgi:hypothetical protein
MSLHDPLAPRKPRRLGLYLPFLLLLAAAAAWTAYWLWARGELQARIDAAQRDLGRAGYQISWSHRGIGGFPFRIDVTLKDARLRDPSGWGLEAPVLEAEAFAYAPGRWMFAAPEGLTFVRPVAGPVLVSGKILRASLADTNKRPPSFSFQGEGLSFQPAPGAQPFSLTAADLVEFHLRPGPDDQGGVFARVNNGKAPPAGVLGRIAGDKPISITWNSTATKMSELQGADWAAAVRRWSDAGGRMTVRDTSQLTAGDALVQARSGTLDVGPDGRLRGTLDVALQKAPQALGAMAASGVLPYATADAASAVTQARQQGATATATISFEAGQITLGPVALGSAPKVYTPH